jgi:predicted amidophosphoribosyltransferase
MVAHPPRAGADASRANADAAAVPRLLDLLLPPACLVCRAPGDTFCRACRAGLPWLPAWRCERCGLPSPCGARCPARDAAFERSWAAVAYDGSARALVHALKLRAMTAAADAMAAQIAATAPAGMLAGGTLVPVPGNPRKRRARGFDPAERIARALARRTALPVTKALRASGAGAAPQARAGRDQRLRRAAFDVVAKAPEHAILVDDVHTTGATLEACARALKAAGASAVIAVSYARTLG